MRLVTVLLVGLGLTAFSPFTLAQTSPAPPTAAAPRAPAFDDATYIALAEALASPLVTCDGPLGTAPGHRVRVEVIR